MLQTQFQNIQDEEKRVVMSAYPGYGNNVVAGEQYAVGFSQQTGGNLDIDVDLGVEEVGQ